MRITGLSQEVERLEKQRDDAVELLGTVLATITVDGNKRYFAAFPDDWRVLVDSWIREFQSIKAVEYRVPRSGCTCPLIDDNTMGIDPACIVHGELAVQKKA